LTRAGGVNLYNWAVFGTYTSLYTPAVNYWSNNTIREAFGFIPNTTFAMKNLTMYNSLFWEMT